MKKLIIANWKMNPQTTEQVAGLYKKIVSGTKRRRKSKIVIAPPFVFITALKKIGGTELGAQDVFWENEGAYTGEVSAKMIKSAGANYVIVGHSERREILGETDEMINKKIRAALKAGLKTVLCVGERDRNDPNFQNFVKKELEADLSGVSKAHAGNLIIAYEPIWAIGTGHTPSADDIFEMATYIRRSIFDILGKKAAYETPVLYGGSVDRKNAGRFLRAKGINGLLVGGASVAAQEFISIVSAADV
ncbi:MAG: triose-phosphate isomerase [Patescibacteria group bacterium]